MFSISKLFLIFFASFLSVTTTFAFPVNIQCHLDSHVDSTLRCHTQETQPYQFSLSRADLLLSTREPVTLYGDQVPQLGCDDEYDPYTGFPCPSVFYAFTLTSSLKYETLLALVSGKNSVDLNGLALMNCGTQLKCALDITELKSNQSPSIVRR